jgi:hypothetical protein
MLTAPLTVLNIRCPSVVYVNRPFLHFKHKVSCDENLMLKTVRGAVNINYSRIPYA